MRPISKGPVPMENGHPKQVSEYGDWRQDLLDRLGYCCCYCNMPLTVSLQVEHVIPKVPQPGDKKGQLLAWDNLILACGPCNRAKSNRPSTPATHYLPESHNTCLAFDFAVYPHPTKKQEWMCLPRPSDHPLVERNKAKATIELCGLDRYKDVDPKAVDLRWQYRYKALFAAKRFRAFWDKGPGDAAAFTGLVREAFQGIGFFPVWMKVFADVPEVCLALIDTFPGTAMDCFDPQGRPVPRNGAHI